MGSQRGDNGATPNGGGLPDLPPEWGVVIIPDDLAELTRESTQVRRELRWQARSVRWRRRLHLKPRKAGQESVVDWPPWADGVYRITNVQISAGFSVPQAAPAILKSLVSVKA